ncbi:MAG: hypothetical protein HeimC2_16940 [Candidatus Heimdallarchaeota archaeon LC_2]|nr:MAG: hypothetical protein HeimC2_16940 [Candidatus Heimdallarchaeota archaeon LC_2]
MDILIIGGTKFLGRALVDAILNKGHNLTLFNRGHTSPEIYQNIEQIHGDRDGEISALGSKKWDVVIDTCGYVPRVVKQSVDFLKDKVKTYVFISTISVYTENEEVNKDENAEIIELEDKNTEDIMASAENYGGLKFLCEEEVINGFDNSIIIRPGLIVGPYDPTNRFTYWPVRIRKGGKILVNNDETYPIQIIDVRDLANFTLHLIENQNSGIYNATGLDYQLTISKLFAVCKLFTGTDLEFVKVNDQWLIDNEVQPWMELPLWIPSESGKALMQVNIEKGIKNGLTFRSLKETVRDTLDWYDVINGDDLDWPAGLKSEREEELINNI